MSPETLTAFRDIGVAGMALIVVILLARTLQQQTKSAGAKDMQENNILKQMIDLATSYKDESSQSREAYRQDSAATRTVVQESNETARAMTAATNEQTAEIRLLRTDFKNYQTLNADTVDGLRNDLGSLRKDLDDLKNDIAGLVKISEANADRHIIALKDREEIHRKLDHIIDAHATRPMPAVADYELPKAAGQ